ncbi:MAG: hypothetical protein HY722_03300 [Planctomycetes bacterium]|nr:hypothetical protein [Planctomycetota bacterium]
MGLDEKARGIGNSNILRLQEGVAPPEVSEEGRRGRVKALEETLRDARLSEVHLQRQRHHLAEEAVRRRREGRALAERAAAAVSTGLEDRAREALWRAADARRSAEDLERRRDAVDARLAELAGTLSLLEERTRAARERPAAHLRPPDPAPYPANEPGVDPGASTVRLGPRTPPLREG